jgi:hypothetical protein
MHNLKWEKIEPGLSCQYCNEPAKWRLVVNSGASGPWVRMQGSIPVGMECAFYYYCQGHAAGAQKFQGPGMMEGQLP